MSDDQPGPGDFRADVHVALSTQLASRGISFSDLYSAFRNASIEVTKDVLDNRSKSEILES